MPANAAAFSLCVAGRARRETIRRSRPYIFALYCRQRESKSVQDDIAQCGQFSRSCFCALHSALARRRPSPRRRPSRTARRWSMAGDCASCHTADPAKPFAGGKRIDTPFGAIYSPNLTPDRDTGLGAWSDDDFYRALRYGVAPDGSRYYPAFPYPYFTKLTRDDLLAIRAYLATLTPFRNARPPPRTALAAELSRGDAGLELPVLPARHLRARSAEKRGMESRRLSGHRCRALRRMPYAEKHLRRRQARLTPLAADRSTAGSRRGSTAPRAAG